MNAPGAKSVGRDRGAERGVDTPRKPHDDARETILVHVITKADDTGRVIGFVALLDLAMRPVDADKAFCATLPNRLANHFRKSRKLECKRAIGIKAEGSAIEDKLVLAAKLIEIDERQFALDNPRDRD